MHSDDSFQYKEPSAFTNALKFIMILLFIMVFGYGLYQAITSVAGSRAGIESAVETKDLASPYKQVH